MKSVVRVAFLIAIVSTLGLLAFAQDKTSKDEMFKKIAQLSNSKKPEELKKAYEMSKEFSAKFGKDNDEKVQKIKKFNNTYRMNAFIKAVDEARIAEANAIAKDILADEPENSYVTLNLAYGGYELYTKKSDKTFSAEATANAKQTLKFFEAGNVPKDLSPFKDQAEATALMYYVIATFALDVDNKEAAANFYKATQFESQIKTNPYAYSNVAYYYEKSYESAAADYQKKHGAKNKEDAEMKADQEKLSKIIDRMIDAYARAVKIAEPQNNPQKDVWKARLTDVYKFRKQSDAGLSEMIANILNTPMPDPASL